MAEKKEITKEGYEALLKEKAYLEGVKRPENIKRIQEARAQGDLSENAEYDSAKNEEAKIEYRLQEINFDLENSIIVTKVSKTIIGVGSTVILKDEKNNREITYKIVGPSETDIFKGKISNESPVGAALSGKKVGETVTIQTPGGVVKYTILKLE